MAAEAAGFVETIEVQGRTWRIDNKLVDQVSRNPRVEEELRKERRLQQWCTEGTVRRFLKGNIYNTPKDSTAQIVKKSVEQLATTLVWRGSGPGSLYADWTVHPEEVKCAKCGRNPASHSLRAIGIDRTRRPVWYTCFAQSIDRWDTKSNVEHMLWSIEESLCMLHRDGDRAEQYVWVVDFHGFSFLKDSNPSSGKELTKLIHHYPERLGLCVLVEAPLAFSALWKIFRGLINEHTASKVQFLSISELERCGLSWCPEPLMRWLLAEMADNRQRKPPAKKAWLPPADPSGHDPRGESSFLKSNLFRLPPWCPGADDFKGAAHTPTDASSRAPVWDGRAGPSAAARRESDSGARRTSTAKRGSAAPPAPVYATSGGYGGGSGEVEGQSSGRGRRLAVAVFLWVAICCTGGAAAALLAKGEWMRFSIALAAASAAGLSALSAARCCVPVGRTAVALLAAAEGDTRAVEAVGCGCCWGSVRLVEALGDLRSRVRRR